MFSFVKLTFPESNGHCSRFPSQKVKRSNGPLDDATVECPDVNAGRETFQHQHVIPAVTQRSILKPKIKEKISRILLSLSYLHRAQPGLL